LIYEETRPYVASSHLVNNHRSSVANFRFWPMHSTCNGGQASPEPFPPHHRHSGCRRRCRSRSALSVLGLRFYVVHLRRAFDRGDQSLDERRPVAALIVSTPRLRHAVENHAVTLCICLRKILSILYTSPGPDRPPASDFSPARSVDSAQGPCSGTGSMPARWRGPDSRRRT